jgi:hypothetical protein
MRFLLYREFWSEVAIKSVMLTFTIVCLQRLLSAFPILLLSNWILFPASFGLGCIYGYVTYFKMIPATQQFRRKP